MTDLPPLSGASASVPGTSTAGSTADFTPAPGVAGIRKAVSTAVTGAIVAAGAALTVALPGGITTAEWLTIAGAFVIGLVGGAGSAYLPANDIVPVTVLGSPGNPGVGPKHGLL